MQISSTANLPACSRAALSKLREAPSLTLADVGHEDTCAICLIPLADLVKDGGAAVAGASHCSLDEEVSECMVGVVKLDLCGHIFCRKECVLSLSFPYLSHLPIP